MAHSIFVLWVSVLLAFASNSLADGFDIYTSISWNRIYVDDDASNDPGSGTQSDPFRRIQDAINYAIDGDKILVFEGTYLENVSINDKSIKLNSIDPNDPNIVAATIIDGRQLGSVVTIVDSNSIIEGFTITNGLAEQGGGMHISNSSPTVTNCTFSGNRTVNYDTNSYGAGMYNFNSTPIVINCSFSGNEAIGYDSSGYGGGIYNLNSNSKITNCAFTENSVDGFYYDDESFYVSASGGGIANDGSNPIITNCIFIGNYSTGGSGVHNYQSSPTITQCTFAGNSADFSNAGDGGGGLCNYQSSPYVMDCSFIGNEGDGGGIRNWLSNPTIRNCNFSGNVAEYSGGGIVNDRSNPTIDNCTFSGNTGWYGGGIGNFQSNNPIITNCTFSDNRAYWLSSGGGMSNSESSPIITNCTFSNNIADEHGGCIYNESSSSPILINSILWGNTAASGGNEIYNSDSIPILSYCDIAGSGGSGIGWDISLGTDGGGNIDSDPLFAVTANNESNLMENVGYNEVFTSVTTTVYRCAVPYGMPENGVVESISIYHAAGSGSCILAVYGDDGTGKPGSCLAVTPTTPVNGIEGWQTVNLTSQPDISAGQTIWLAWVFENNPGLRYRNGTPARANSGQTWAGGMPETFGTSTTANYIYSIYATYVISDTGPQDRRIGNMDLFPDITTTASRRAVPYTMPEDGKIQSITLYHEAGNGDFILAVYADDGSGKPGTRLAITTTTPVSSNAGWQKVDLIHYPAVNEGQTIWLAWVFENMPGLRYKSGTPGRADSGLGWADGMRWNFGSSTIANYIYSIYADYYIVRNTNLAVDYHLKSEYGRWDPNGRLWVDDAETSPCIDAGDPADLNWKHELWPHGKRINMGVYGGTPEASRSSSMAGNIANLNDDVNDSVDLVDFSCFSQKWQVIDDLLKEDLDRDGQVDLEDLLIFSEQWLFEP